LNKELVKGKKNNLLNVENNGLHLYVSSPSIFFYVKKHLLMKIFTFAGGFGVKNSTYLSGNHCNYWSILLI